MPSKDDPVLQVFFRCYAELNDFLPPEQRYRTNSLLLPPRTTIEEFAATVGIPAETIDLVLANGTSVALTYYIEENDRLSLYPVFETFDISSVTKARRHPLRQPRFILDVHLGKLANHLRMFGFDTLYRNNYRDDILIDISLDEHRILLSKDRSLIENPALTHTYRVQNKEPRLQLIEVLEKFDLYSLAAPFTRCIECNSLLKSVEKSTILPQIPPLVISWCNEYQRCVSCNRIYWKGSHYQAMSTFVESILRR